MEMEMIFRLSLLVGFLMAGFLGILIGAAIVGLRYWYKTSVRELDQMLDDLEKVEEGNHHET